MANDDDIKYNLPVVSTEYGTTRYKGSRIVLSPATRVGNVTRLITLSDLYGKAGEAMLELSFPALRGTSGAPVLSNDDFMLWGIIVANVSYHLLPAQIESVLEAEKVMSEETRFMLPQAVAVNVRHVRAIINEL